MVGRRLGNRVVHDARGQGITEKRGPARGRGRHSGTGREGCCTDRRGGAESRLAGKSGHGAARIPRDRLEDRIADCARAAEDDDVRGLEPHQLGGLCDSQSSDKRRAIVSATNLP